MDLKEQVKKLLPSIHGWCSVEKAEKLMDYIANEKPKIIVEIGVFGGSSLIPQVMATKANGVGMVYGIDPWKSEDALEEMTGKENLAWWSTVNLNDIYKHCREHLKTLDLGKYCKLIRDKSENVVDQFENESIDLLHVDGNHSEVLSYKDVTLYISKVKPGGLIFFDDIWWTEGDSTVTTRKALMFLFEHCDKIDLINNDCLVFRKR
jgi:predicted O-methyltransferase YrrM